MKNKLMLGLWKHIVNIPPFLWKKQIARAKKRFEAECGTLSREYRLLHHFVVRELPFAGRPLSPEYIGRKLNLPPDRVSVILADLEKRLTFLFRDKSGKVVWAYPVTVEKTPHHLTFNTGEQLYAA